MVPVVLAVMIYGSGSRVCMMKFDMYFEVEL